jgi:hypothetical protein
VQVQVQVQVQLSLLKTFKVAGSAAAYGLQYH